MTQLSFEIIPILFCNLCTGTCIQYYLKFEIDQLKYILRFFVVEKYLMFKEVVN